MLRTFFKLSFTVLVLAILLRVVGWEKLIGALNRTALNWLLIMYVMVLAARAVESYQMHLVMRKVGSNIPVTRIFLANSLSSLYSLVLPGDLLAGAAKWGNLSAATGKKSMVLNAIIYNRLALIMPPLITGAIALCWENPFPTSFITEGVISLAALMFLVVFSLFHPRYGRITDRIVLTFSRILPGPIKERIHMVLASLQKFRAYNLKDHLTIYSVAVLSMFGSLLIFAIATKTMGLNIPLLTLAWTLAILISSRQLPITINNLGIREGILIVVLSRYNVAPEQAVALGLILFSGQVVMALVGLSYQIALALGWAKWKSTTD